MFHAQPGAGVFIMPHEHWHNYANGSATARYGWLSRFHPLCHNYAIGSYAAQPGVVGSRDYTHVTVIMQLGQPCPRFSNHRFAVA